MLPNVVVPPYMKRLTMGAPKTLTYEDSASVIGGSNFLLIMKVFSNSHEGFALAWLSSHIPARRRLASIQTTQKLSVEGLQMRARSIKLLQQELLKHPGQSQDSLVSLRLHIRGLFETECMVGDTRSNNLKSSVISPTKYGKTPSVAMTKEMNKRLRCSWNLEAIICNNSQAL
jgi:hypothetical protein